MTKKPNKKPLTITAIAVILLMSLKFSPQKMHVFSEVKEDIPAVLTEKVDTPVISLLSEGVDPVIPNSQLVNIDVDAGVSQVKQVIPEKVKDTTPPKATSDKLEVAKTPKRSYSKPNSIYSSKKPAKKCKCIKCRLERFRNLFKSK